MRGGPKEAAPMLSPYWPIVTDSIIAESEATLPEG
jgi:hypothetical protein